MEKLVKTIATALVDNKEAVEVTSRQDKHTVIIEIKADSKDLGKIIGKEGKIAKAIRTCLLYTSDAADDAPRV